MTNATKNIATGAQPVSAGWHPGQPITEEMHVAAVKVLHRASGLGGLPQRMLDAMLAAAPVQPVAPADATPDGEPSNVELRGMWYGAGGTFHGPNVETGTMPEAKLLPFLRSLASGGQAPAGAAPVATLHCNDVGYVWARVTPEGKNMRFEQPINLYPTAQAAPAAGNWIDANDVKRLVRQLDVALNGKAGAAIQASLCDIVAQVEHESAKRGRPVLAATIPNATLADLHEGLAAKLHDGPARNLHLETAAALRAPAAGAVAGPVKWWNGCDKSVPAALRFLADHERPAGGESNYNSEHLYQLADEIERMASAPLYAAPTPAAQAQAVAVPLPKFLALKFHARRDKKATVTLLFPDHEAADAWVRGIRQE